MNELKNNLNSKSPKSVNGTKFRIYFPLQCSREALRTVIR